MGFKIKNSLTGEFEKLPILTLKGEKGETGGVEEYNKVDYMGNKYETLKQANDANVEYAVKTAIGEFNYLDYDGQHITATDTIEGRSKSAILSGNTLVNLMSENERFSASLDGTNPSFWTYKYFTLNQNLKPNTNYTLIFNANISQSHLIHIGGKTGNAFNSTSLSNVVNGVNKFLITTYSDITDKEMNKLFIQSNNSNSVEIALIDFILIEGDHTNEDIPYFIGMQSVKLPILKSVGKNLFGICEFEKGVAGGFPNTNITITNNSISFSEIGGSVAIKLKGKPNTKYTISFIVNNTSTMKLREWNNRTQTTDVNGEITWLYGSYNPNTNNGLYKLENIQIEEGSAATPYEPYKSNILTVNDDVTLRGIGDVQDELNLITGELTQRIGETTLDGSEGWWMNEMEGKNTNRFRITFDSKEANNVQTIKCGEMKSVPNQQWETDEEIIEADGVYLTIRKPFDTEKEFTEWLSQNPITIQYQAKTELIKTVDLSDNHVYSYKDVTHYDCSSAEGSLVPTLSVKVPTDVQATIAQQRETIQTLNSENERLNQIQEALKASMLDSQVQLMNLSWDIDFEVFTLRESITPKVFLLDSRTGSNIDKFSQAKFIIENDCPDLEKLNSQIEYYFSKDVFSQEQFEELTDLISIVKGENGCEY